MRLYTFRVASPSGSLIRIGAEENGWLVDLNAACAACLAARGEPDAAEYAGFLVPPDMVGYLGRGEKARQAVLESLDFVAREGPEAGLDGTQLVYDPTAVDLMAPVPRPNLVWDAMVFHEHVRVMREKRGLEVPAEFFDFPAYFHQSGAVVAGPYDPIVKPRFTEQLDFELEFGVYIGRKGIDIPAKDAESHIAGFTVYNDLSARDVQGREMKMLLGPAKGKNFEGANIMGPCLVTLDEIDYDNLRMVARVNGEVVADDCSSGMYHKFPRIIEWISQEQYLYPGDFIGSGTSDHGTCQASTLKRWLQVGDVVELEVEGIGALRNQVVAGGER